MACQPDHIRTSFAAVISQLFRLWRRSVDVELQPFGLTQATRLALLHIAHSKEGRVKKIWRFHFGSPALLSR
jgi:hypothetical protein